MFQKAVKTEAKLRLAIAGPSGSGKTYTALAVGTALADGGPVAVLDTEHGSASKYADLFAFDVLNESAPFHPDKVVAAIQAATTGGYTVLILDSMSHFWNGPGGMTDIVDGIARRMKTANSFAAWKDGTPIQQRMIEAIVSAPIHIIATMRSKQDYVLEVGSDGKSRPRKVGMAPIQRDGFEYEFDVFIDMDNDNNGIIAKTRCPALANGVFKKPGADVAAILRDWLKGEPAPQPAPTQRRSGREEFAKSIDENDTKYMEGAGGPVSELWRKDRHANPQPPLADDELVVSETPAREFISTVATMLETDAASVKERLHALGYTGIPRDAAKRVDVYRRVKAAVAEDALGAAEQDGLFQESDSHTPAVTGAYSE